LEIDPTAQQIAMVALFTPGVERRRGRRGSLVVHHTLALWTLRYWELAKLAPPIFLMLAARLPLSARSRADCLSRARRNVRLRGDGVCFFRVSLWNDGEQPGGRGRLAAQISDFVNVCAIVLSRTALGR
jgi:hypothetical protein